MRTHEERLPLCENVFSLLDHMLILFTGSRGSGKTTIAKALYSMLDERSVRYLHQNTWREKGMVKKWWFGLYLWTFFDAHIFTVYFGRLRRDIRHGRSKGSLYRIYVPLIFSYYVSQLEKNRTDAVIYDTDVLTWAADKVLDGVFTPEEVQDFYRMEVLPRVGALFIMDVDTPVEESIKRWNKRDDKKLSRGEEVTWVEKREQWKQAREKVVEIVSALPGVTLIRLSGVATPQSNAERVVTQMQKLLGAGSIK